MQPKILFLVEGRNFSGLSCKIPIQQFGYNQTCRMHEGGNVSNHILLTFVSKLVAKTSFATNAILRAHCWYPFERADEGLVGY
jgi:hypothetical protein